MNDEARMSNDEGNPNAQMTNAVVAAILVIRHFDHCFVIRHSDFVITDA